MRKIYWFAAAALILTGIGGWAASTTHARVDIPAAAVGISPVELMTTTKTCPSKSSRTTPWCSIEREAPRQLPSFTFDRSLSMNSRFSRADIRQLAASKQQKCPTVGIPAWGRP